MDYAKGLIGADADAREAPAVEDDKGHIRIPQHGVQPLPRAYAFAHGVLVITLLGTIALLGHISYEQQQLLSVLTAEQGGNVHGHAKSAPLKTFMDCACPGGRMSGAPPPPPMGPPPQAVPQGLPFLAARAFLIEEALPETMAQAEPELDPAIVYQKVPDGKKHVTASRHMMLEISQADAEILDSEEAIRALFLKIVKDLGMHVLSITSAKLEPQGVSAVVVLSESHLSIHTWPELGYAAIDLFTCGAANPIDGLGLLVDGFKAKEYTWSMHNRGMGSTYEPDDVETMVLGDLYEPTKTLVDHVKSKYQDIQVWDTGGGWHWPAMPNSKTRCLFTDGHLQSCLLDEHIYHEALVHPAMFAHPDPKYVAVVGGGEGATVREVLRHNTVRETYMVEIDQQIVEIAKRSLPEMGGNSWADPRLYLVHEDADAWFNNRYGPQKGACVPAVNGKRGPNPCLDVVIMDVQDPETVPTFTRGLFSREFIMSLWLSLSEDGVVVWQFGAAPAAKHTTSKDVVMLKVMNMLSSVFEDVSAYQQFIPTFLDTWAFVVAFKGPKSVARFNRNSAAIELDIGRRLGEGKSQLHLFDGPQMRRYQHMESAYQHHFCSAEWAAQTSEPASVRRQCEWADATAGGGSYTETRPNTPGLFASRDLHKGQQVFEGDASTSIEISAAMYDQISQWSKVEDSTGLRKQLLDWIDTHGYHCRHGGGTRYFSLSPTISRVQSTCNQSEANLAQGDELADRDLGRTFDIVFDRHRRKLCVEQAAKQEVHQGQELLRDGTSQPRHDCDYESKTENMLERLQVQPLDQTDFGNRLDRTGMDTRKPLEGRTRPAPRVPL